MTKDQQDGSARQQFIAKMADQIVSGQAEKTKADRDGNRQDKTAPAAPENPILKFDMNPQELEHYLDQYVIRQREAKRTVATKVCTHYRSVRHQLEQGQDPMKAVDDVKSNILLLGPTGVGKTYIIKLLADKLGVPFVKADATKYSETGYVGGDVEDIVRDLVKMANGDVERAQYGIVFIDEVDKIASASNLAGRDVSGKGVQTNLLKIIEDAEVELVSKYDMMGQVERAMEAQASGGKVKRPTKISTKNILFVFSGAFPRLEEIIKRRMRTGQIGFVSQEATAVAEGSYLKHVMPEDLQEFGFEPEFIGRIPVTGVLENLEANDLYAILKNTNCSIVRRKTRDFAAYGIELKFEDDALRYFAEKAAEQRTGARALVRVIDAALLNYESRLPDTGISSFAVTKDLVDGSVDQDALITQIALRVPFKTYQDEIKKNYGVSLEFDDEAKRVICAEARKQRINPYRVCKDRFQHIEQGFGLVKTQGGDGHTMLITSAAVDDPNKFVADYLRNLYSAPKGRKAK